MGKLSQFKEENPEIFEKKESSQGSSIPENIAVKITAYEESHFVGLRLDNKEEVKVFLRPIEQNEKSRHKRLELEDFADPSHKRHVPIGGVILFENSYKQSEGLYNARWASCLSRDPKETMVKVLLCSLIYGKKNSTDGSVLEWILVKTVFPEKKTFVSTLQEFETVITNELHPMSAGSNPFVIVKITDGEDSEAIEIYPQRVDSEYGKKPADGKVSADAFLNSDKSKMVKELLGEEGVNVEIIPARVVYPGASTKEKMLDAHANARKILEESFYIKDEEGNIIKNGILPEIGYLNCSLATRRHADGSMYVTHIKPLVSFAKPLKSSEL